MKILLISDIHGNWAALQAVLAAEPDVDQILCLGDLVNYGPQPAECVAWAMKTLTSDWLIAVLRAFAEENGIKAGQLINGSRAVLTGQAVAPSLFAVMAYLGKDRVVRRLLEAESIKSEMG